MDFKAGFYTDVIGDFYFDCDFRGCFHTAFSTHVCQTYTLTFGHKGTFSSQLMIGFKG